MKSLKERLAEKAIRDERKRRKRSVKYISYLSLKVPRISQYVEGDAIYIQERVKKLIEQIQNRSTWEVFTEFRKQFVEIDKQIKAEQAENDERMRQIAGPNGFPQTNPVNPTTAPERQIRRPRRGRPPVRANRNRGLTEILRVIDEYRRR